MSETFQTESLVVGCFFVLARFCFDSRRKAKEKFVTVCDLWMFVCVCVGWEGGEERKGGGLSVQK